MLDLCYKIDKQYHHETLNNVNLMLAHPVRRWPNISQHWFNVSNTCAAWAASRGRQQLVHEIQVSTILI